MELLKVSKDKRALKFVKKRVSIDRNESSSVNLICISIIYMN